MAGEGGLFQPHNRRAAEPPQEPPATTANITEAIQTIEAFVQSANWPERARDAWKHVKDAAAHRARSDTCPVSKDFQELKTQVKGLTDLVKGIARQPVATTTYADALRSKGGLPSNGLAGGGSRVLPVPARRARELVVAPGAETDTQKDRTSLELVRDINTATSGSGDAVAARRLPSGDVLVAFQSVLEKQKWEACSEAVLQAFGAGARLRAREYTVLAHGVQVRSVNQANQTRAIEDIYSQNPRLRDTVRIVRVGWARKTLKYGKRIAALHIGIAEPDQANLLIDTGLLLDSELHDCELFDGSCYITQCFKCYQYNHTVKHCKGVGRCGFCGSAGHSSQDCNKKDDSTAFHCIPCRKQGHVSWARECPVRRQQVEKAQQAYASRPSKFQVRAASSGLAHTATATTSVYPATANHTELVRASSTQPASSIQPASPTTAAASYTELGRASSTQPASPNTATPRDPSPGSVIVVEMPDQVLGRELMPLSTANALARPRKRARPLRATIQSDSDSDFPDPHSFTLVKSRRSRTTTQGTQDIRNALALVPQPSPYNE
jgi:hypothetical protein